MNETPKYRCPNCGTLVYKKEKYCRKCGTRLKRYYAHKKQIILAIMVVIIIIFMNVNSDHNRKMKQLRALATEPRTHIEYPQTSSEVIMNLDSDAFWKNEENIAAISQGLSDSDLQILKSVIENLNSEDDFHSRQELLDDLSYESISKDHAEPIIDLCQVDFKMQALKRSLYLMNVYSFSPDSLKEELISYEFTPEEAEYAVENCNADWELQTKLAVQSYLYNLELSEQGVYGLMEYDKYDVDIAKKCVEELNPDWNRECLQAAVSTPHRGPADLQSYLEFKEFTPEQIDYVMDLMY